MVRIYASITNHHHIPYKLTENGMLTNTTVTGGSGLRSIRRLERFSGKPLTLGSRRSLGSGPSACGTWPHVTVANGRFVRLLNGQAREPNQMFALDAAAGVILWEFKASGAQSIQARLWWIVPSAGIRYSEVGH
jgi:hypothetical protein